MTYRVLYTTLLLFAALLLNACVSDKPDIKPGTAIKADTNAGVYITNEGNYQKGNSSVSYYDSGRVASDVYATANGRALGDVCQSMTIFNGKGYVVVNNSGKIEVVDPQTFQSIAVINGLTSPRYFLGINNSKAYVTDLYSNSVSVIDLVSNTKVKDIRCSAETEELLLADNKAYVTNAGKNYVYSINTLTDVMEDSIVVGEQPSSLRLDKNGKLWVMCEGRNDKGIAGSLFKIDLPSGNVELNLEFALSATDSPWRLSMNGTADTLYYLFNGVYKMPVTANVLPDSPLIAQKNGSEFYGLGIDPVSGIIYVADALDYVQKGTVRRYMPNGTLVNSFNVGIIPGGFCFY